MDANRALPVGAVLVEQAGDPACVEGTALRAYAETSGALHLGEPNVALPPQNG